MSRERERFIRNALALTAADLGARLAAAAFVVLAARWLGTEGYGLYAAALTALAFARTVGRLGLQGVVVVREVAQHPELASRYFSSAVALMLPQAILLAVGIPWIVGLLGYAPDLVALLRLLAVALLAHALARPAEEILRALEELTWLSGVTAALAVGSMLAGTALLAMGGGLRALALVHVVSSWMEAAVLFALLRHRVPALAWVPSWAMARRLAREGGLLFVLMLCELVQSRADVLVLARLAGSAAVGVYVPGLRIVEYVALFRVGILSALLPFLAARAPTRSHLLGRAYARTQRLFAAYAVGAAVILTVGAEPILALLFGPAYGPGAPALRLLAWAMVAEAMSGPVAEVVFVARRPLGRYLPGQVALAFGSVLLNLVLVIRWAHVGAALAVLLTAAASLAFRMVWIREILADQPFEGGSPVGAGAWRALAAGLAMAAVFAILTPLGFWSALLPATATYAGCLILTGGLRRDEIEWVWRVAVRRAGTERD